MRFVQFIHAFEAAGGGWQIIQWNCLIHTQKKKNQINLVFIWSSKHTYKIYTVYFGQRNMDTLMKRRVDAIWLASYSLFGFCSQIDKR